MTKLYKYTYIDLEGKKTELKKAITDRMAADKDKKTCAASWFRQMLEHAGYTEPDIVVRNIQEV
jgi:hypothetical protein